MKRHAFVLASTALLLASPARASKSCVETSDVVGEQRCSRYGDGWSSEGSLPLTLEFGLVRTTFGLGGRDFSAKFGKNGPEAYRFDGGTFASEARTYGFSLRATGFLSPFVYVGFEQSFGFGHAEGGSFQAGTYAVSTASGLNTIAAVFGVPFGVRVSLGKLALRGEVFGGLTILTLNQDANGARASGTWVGGAVEARGYLDLWLANDTTFSVMVGQDLLGHDDRRLGLVLTYHGRAYDGRYGF